MSDKIRQFGSYPGLNQYIAIKALFNFFGKSFGTLPKLDADMLKWGESKSPEYACLPFKMYLGYCRELAKNGINDVFVYGARRIRACRYTDLLEGIQKILRDEGFSSFTVHYWGGYGLRSGLVSLDRIMGKSSLIKKFKGIAAYAVTLQVADAINDLANEMRPREVIGGEIDLWLEKWNKKLELVRNRKESWQVLEQAKKDIGEFKLDQDKKLVPVVFVGDLLKVHEPVFHFDSIRKLNKLGVIIKQPQPFSLLFFGTTNLPSRGQYAKKFKAYRQKAKKYLKSVPGSYIDVGIGEVVSQLDDGAKGIIHFQSFGCMPDIMCRPILDRVAKDYNVPIIHYMRDTHAHDVAYQTRLEAFVDLIKRKKDANIPDLPSIGRGGQANVDETVQSKNKSNI